MYSTLVWSTSAFYSMNTSDKKGQRQEDKRKCTVLNVICSKEWAKYYDELLLEKTATLLGYWFLISNHSVNTRIQSLIYWSNSGYIHVISWVTKNNFLIRSQFSELTYNFTRAKPMFGSIIIYLSLRKQPTFRDATTS